MLVSKNSNVLDGVDGYFLTASDGNYTPNGFLSFRAFLAVTKNPLVCLRPLPPPARAHGEDDATRASAGPPPCWPFPSPIPMQRQRPAPGHCLPPPVLRRTRCSHHYLAPRSSSTFPVGCARAGEEGAARARVRAGGWTRTRMCSWVRAGWCSLCPARGSSGSCGPAARREYLAGSGGVRWTCRRCFSGGRTPSSLVRLSLSRPVPETGTCILLRCRNRFHLLANGFSRFLLLVLFCFVSRRLVVAACILAVLFSLFLSAALAL